MLSLHCNLLKRIVMKTMKVEESVEKVAQIIFRHSAERRGYYRCHYGYLASDGTFAEVPGVSFSSFLGSLGIPADLVDAFVGDLSDSELEVCDFGYFSQKRFDEFVRYFLTSCGAVMLYPGMLVLTFNEEEDED